MTRPPHKNRSRAPLRPLDARTLALSVGGVGFLRPAPGTLGSAVPAAAIYAMLLLDVPAPLRNAAVLAMLVGACVVCVCFGRYAERRFGRTDAPEVVADEVAGQCLPMLFWPASLTARCCVDQHGLAGASIATVMVGSAFLLFRVFDIVKPWPAGRLERAPGGWGVLLDDLMAGVYATICWWALTALALWFAEAPA